MSRQVKLAKQSFRNLSASKEKRRFSVENHRADLGNSEVQQLGALASRHVRVGQDHHVFRFEIAVDNPWKNGVEKSDRGGRSGKHPELAAGLTFRVWK